ncbi:MAG TPA: holo-ACP synthase [Acidobacteriota bacterium]|nr:holo-ACP synthase [Acidobacteriota bacterium]
MILGIGMDLFEIARLERLLEREGEDLLPELFSSAEIEYGNRLRQPQHFFARSFAAKEAVIKAIGSPELRGFYWRDIEIRTGGNVWYAVQFMGMVRDLIRKLRIESIHLSVEATDRFAIAVAVACGSLRKEQDHG